MEKDTSDEKDHTERYFKKLDIKLVKGEYPNPLKGRLRLPEQVYEVFSNLKDNAKETVIGIFLDNDLEVRAYEVLAIGTDQGAILSSTEIYRHAIVLTTNYFILVHNHPKGNPLPSPSDREIMNILDDKHIAGKLQIQMLDFVIIGDLDNPEEKNYWSMFEEANGGEYTLGTTKME